MYEDNALNVKRLNDTGNKKLVDVHDVRQQNITTEKIQIESKRSYFQRQKSRTGTTRSAKPALGLELPVPNAKAPICASAPPAHAWAFGSERPPDSFEASSSSAEPDESSQACNSVRNVAGLGVDLSAYPTAAPYAVYLASLQRFVPRRLVHRPKLHVVEREASEYDEHEEEQNEFAELRKSA